MTLSAEDRTSLDRIRAVLEGHRGHYKNLAGAKDFPAYLAAGLDREDEEILTEPIMKELVERVLGFPVDGYFAQFGRGGLKPDLTPMDTIAHPFVLDAKSSAQKLGPHEPQIRAYISQRQLDYGVLFNLHELRTYRRGQKGHDPTLSFSLLSLWEVATGQAMPAIPDVERFLRWASVFAYREMGRTEKLEQLRKSKGWAEREASGESVEVDLDYLVEQLRDLSELLTEDAAAQIDALRAQLKVSQGRERLLLRELEVLALDIAPGTTPDALPDRVDGYLGGDDLAQRVWGQYLRRVAQMALARTVLYRAWEEVAFVDELLYDGGFGEVYDRIGSNLGKVLDEAFTRGLQQYRWLFGSDNNYDWFKPRDEALAEVLYRLIPFPLGKLDADVLGGLYESYVDEIDRDRLGQFYTPRSVVKFMLDRAGFAGADGVFRLEGNERRPLRILDFATGSGGFLVEAARRMIDEGGVDAEDVNGLTEALAAIANGFHGVEISPFPYYLTEINLLLQVSRLLGQLTLAAAPKPTFVLGVVHSDTLTARTGGASSFEGLNAGDRKDEGKLAQDEGFGLVPLDAEKQAAFDRIREDSSFDLVVGNPPYVFETNNRVLFERLRGIPAWKGLYRGKSDYLYYFLTLAAEKVKPGGRLCVITPAAWMNAGNADWLRERLASALRLDQLYLFGSYRLFAPEQAARRRQHGAPTPTVESAILLATKAKPRANHKLRIVVLEDEVAAAQALSGNEETRSPDRDALLDEMALRGRGKVGRKAGIHALSIPQAELAHDRPWPIKHSAEDVAARVVAHLQAKLNDVDSAVDPLADRWSIPQGIQTGADAYTPRIQKRLRQSFPKALRRLEQDGAQLGEPIMELPAGREKQPPWKEHPDLLARSIEPRAILYGALDEAEYTSLVWLGRGDEPPKAIVTALEPWRPVLENRADFIANPTRRWWETHRTRAKAQLRRPKVIALYRTDRGRFALDEDGSWQPSIKTTLVISKGEDLSAAYLCGLLNSELLDLWYSVRGKTPRDVWRNYEPKPMARIPYRHVEDIGAGRDGRVKELNGLLESESADLAADLADEIGSDFRKGSGDEREVAAALESIVRAIAENRRRLLPHRDRVPDLTAIVKDPWRTGSLDVSEEAMLATLPKKDTVSVRLDKSLTLTIEAEGVLGRPKLEGGGLAFTYKRAEAARIDGPPERLQLLERLLAHRNRILDEDLKGQLLPQDLAAFDALIDAEGTEVDRLLAVGRTLVEAAERLACRIYDVPPELEDDVVEHAIARASLASAP